MTEKSLVPTFDYSKVDAETAAFVQSKKRDMQKRTVLSIVADGRDLGAIKQKMGDKLFHEWVDEEYWFTYRTALKRIHVAEMMDANGRGETSSSQPLDGKTISELYELAETARRPQIEGQNTSATSYKYATTVVSPEEAAARFDAAIVESSPVDDLLRRELDIPQDEPVAPASQNGHIPQAPSTPIQPPATVAPVEQPIKKFREPQWLPSSAYRQGRHISVDPVKGKPDRCKVIYRDAISEYGSNVKIAELDDDLAQQLYNGLHIWLHRNDAPEDEEE